MFRIVFYYMPCTFFHWFCFLFFRKFSDIFLFSFERHLKAFCFPKFIKCFIFNFNFLFRKCYIIESRKIFENRLYAALACCGLVTDFKSISDIIFFEFLKSLTIYASPFYKCLSAVFVSLCSLRN